MIDYVCKQASKESSIVDLGCGNAHLLIELHKKGYLNLCGLDYSANSIELATKICTMKGIRNIQLKQRDVIASKDSNIVYDVVLDKGTFDGKVFCPTFDGISDCISHFFVSRHDGRAKTSRDISRIYTPIACKGWPVHLD